MALHTDVIVALIVNEPLGQTFAVEVVVGKDGASCRKGGQRQRGLHFWQEDLQPGLVGEDVPCKCIYI